MSEQTVPPQPEPTPLDPHATRASAVPDTNRPADLGTVNDPDPDATNPDPGRTVALKARPAGARAAVPGYEILDTLGRGGMGVVYLARQLKLNRVVALKMVLSGDHAGPEELARFVTEAEAVAQLQHPNIVQIFESGEHDGLPYFSLEYVAGGTLAALVREQPLPPRDAARLVEQLARGVAFAHSRGIVHRDLKPENVLLASANAGPSRDPEGAAGDSTARSRSRLGPDSAAPLVPKIADFGLAKRLQLDPEATSGGRGSGQTHTGAVVGTPSYMAPEQARGAVRQVGPLADVYALGAILYRVLTGRPPFQAASVHETLLQVITEEPVPLGKLQPGLPRDLETIALKCLQKDPARRYASAVELADDLHRYLTGQPIVARPVGRLERAIKWVRRSPVVAALSAALVAAVALGFALVTWNWLDARESERLALQALASEKTAKEREADARREADKKRKEAVDAQEDAECKRLEAVKARNDEKAAREAEEKEKNRVIEQRDLARKYLARAQEAVDKLTLISEGDSFLKNEPRFELVRKKLLREALEYHKSFLAEQSADPTVRGAAATAYRRMASLHLQLGEHEEGILTSLRAIDLFETLAADFPASPAYRQDLASSYNNLGVLLVGKGDGAKAEKLYRKALALQDRLAAEFPTSPEYREGLALSCNNLAALLSANGERPEPEKLHRKALKLREQLAADFPASPKYCDDLSQTCSNLANLLSTHGERAEVEKLYRRALALREQLAAEFPTSPEYREGLALSCNNLGALLEANGERGEAERLFRKALELGGKLASDFPASPEYRHDLAISCCNLGLVLQVKGEHAEPEKLFRRALELQDMLPDAFRASVKWREFRARVCNNLASLLYEGEPAEAEKLYREALKLLDKLAADYPASEVYLQYLASSCNNLGVLLNVKGDRAEAEKLSRKAVELGDRLTADFPTSSAYRRDLARSCYNLGLLLQDKGEFAEAEKFYRKALDIQDKLTADSPDSLADRTGLSKTCINLGVLLNVKGDQAEAEKLYRKALAVLEQLATDYPATSASCQDLARCYSNLALLLAGRGERVEAENFHRKALKLQVQLVSGFPTVPAYRQYLATYCSNLLALWSAQIETCLAGRQPVAASCYAGQITTLPVLTDLQRWTVAWLLARCAAAAPRDMLLTNAERPLFVQACCDQAVELLQQAVQGGLKVNPAVLRQHPDFAVLRDHPGLRALLAQLEGKSANEPPPPRDRD